MIEASDKNIASDFDDLPERDYQDPEEAALEKSIENEKKKIECWLVQTSAGEVCIHARSVSIEYGAAIFFGAGKKLVASFSQGGYTSIIAVDSKSKKPIAVNLGKGE